MRQFLFRKSLRQKKVKQMSWKVRQFLFRKLFRQTTSNRWVPRGCDALDKRLANDFVRGEIDLKFIRTLQSQLGIISFKKTCIVLKGTCRTGRFKTNIRRKNVSDEIERVKGCDCLLRPNKEWLISWFRVFVNYHHKKYILRLFPFSLWFCITITIVICIISIIMEGVWV